MAGSRRDLGRCGAVARSAVAGAVVGGRGRSRRWPVPAFHGRPCMPMLLRMRVLARAHAREYAHMHPCVYPRTHGRRGQVSRELSPVPRACIGGGHSARESASPKGAESEQSRAPSENCARIHTQAHMRLHVTALREYAELSQAEDDLACVPAHTVIRAHTCAHITAHACASVHVQLCASVYV